MLDSVIFKPTRARTGEIAATILRCRAPSGSRSGQHPLQERREPAISTVESTDHLELRRRPVAGETEHVPHDRHVGGLGIERSLGDSSIPMLLDEVEKPVGLGPVRVEYVQRFSDFVVYPATARRSPL